MPKSTGKERLTILRCVSTLLGDLHRLLTNNNTSISSIGMIRKRFNTHNAPTTFQTQQIRDDHQDDSDDKLDSITYESFEMFLIQVLQTLKSLHTFLFTPNQTSQSMDIDDEHDILIDRDQSRDLASRAFYYALDSLYFLFSLFKVKQSNWQKEFDRDSICFNHLLTIINTHLLSTNKTTTDGGNETDRIRILKKFFSFANILNLIDSMRLCQSLELFIQLFDDETHQVLINICVSAFYSLISG